MNATDLIALSPLIVMAVAVTVVLVVVAFYRNHLVTLLTTMAGLAVAAACLPGAAEAAPRRVTPLLVIDNYALLYMGLILAASAIVALLAHGYLERQEEHREEFYILLLLASLGSMVLVASSHLVSLFLGLETLSVGLYVLIAYLRRGRRGVEAGLKYLILAGASSAFLLFGMALVYGELGTMELEAMAVALAAGNGGSLLLLAGLGLMVTGIGFKLALVPFHMWTPDVYEGAPAPVTAFVATVSKGAMFALVLRYFAALADYAYEPLFWVFSLMAIASMVVGNLLALLQDNVKRILAYSSIAHLGYLLVAFLASGELAALAVTFYLVAYFVTTLGAFGVVAVLADGEGEPDAVADYRGLYWRRPWLAAVLTATLLSLAGIPLTAGFIGKFWVLAAGVDSALWLLVIFLVVNSAVGLYYYLRIVVVMVAQPGDEPAPSAAAVPLAGGLALAVVSLLLVWFGVYPGPLLRLIETAVASLS